MGWISVKDKLPENDGEWYLIASGCNRPHEEFVVTIAFFDKGERYGVHWLCHNDGYKCPTYDGWENVTHWMPLPEPPND